MNPLAQSFLTSGQSPDCPVINTHAHFGPYRAIYFPRCTPERVIEMMDGAGIRWLIAAAHEALTDTQLGNRNYAAIIARHPDRLKGYWAINPLYPDRVKQEVAEYEQFSGFVGFKFLSDYYQYPITGDNYKPALEYADAHKLAILLHTWGGSQCDGPALWPKVA
ncbi:MAG: amidohydrolase family protein, partial [Armatimonadetes bacterium]|nr:amidohydrolase family protein [Armatimonadota bacterium]